MERQQKRSSKYQHSVYETQGRSDIIRVTIIIINHQKEDTGLSQVQEGLQIQNNQQQPPILY